MKQIFDFIFWMLIGTVITVFTVVILGFIYSVLMLLLNIMWAMLIIVLPITLILGLYYELKH